MPYQIHTFSLLLSVLVLISTDQVSCDTFYIVTESGNYCPEEYLSTSPPGQNCLTLSEFARNVDRQLLDPENLILTLESGLHSLESPLVVSSNLSSFTISPVANLSSPTTTIWCRTGHASYGGLQISAVENVLIKGINFNRCSGTNKVKSVATFRLEVFGFHSSTLNLEYVNNASIVRGSFSANSVVNTTLYVYMCTLLLKETDFVGNTGSIVGALQLIDSDAVVDQCTFLNNQVRHFAFFAYCGGAIFASARTIREFKNLTIISSNFTANDATDGSNPIGGAICIKKYASLVISNCTFERNVAVRDGGAISVVGDNRVIHIDTSQFIKNSVNDAEAYGSGALHIYRSSSYDVRIDRSNFTNNTGGVRVLGDVSNFYCTRSEFTSNRGRALYITQQGSGFTALVSIEQCNFTGNFDRSWNYLNNREAGGGAVTIQALRLFYRNTNLYVLVNGSTFTNNYANFSGGAVKVITFSDRFDSYILVRVHNSSFVNNTGSNNVDNFGHGGAMNINITGSNSSVSITQSVFINNKCKSYQLSPILKGGGGALALAADRIVLNETGFIHNEANFGGAIYINRTDDLLITDSSFVDNVVSAPQFDQMPVSAGALFVDTNTNFTTIKRSVFQNNTASKCGAIDFNHGAYRGNNELSISESYFENNRATESEGGVICISRGVVSISNTSFIGNSAFTSGGVISAQNTMLNHDSQAQIDNSSFLFNYASSGGVLSVGSGFKFDIQDVTFDGNIAEMDGDVITACNSTTVLPDELSSLLFIHTDPQYEDNLCIYYDELIHDIPTLNSTTTNLPTVTTPTTRSDSNGSEPTSQPSTVPTVPTSSSVNETNSTSTTGPVIVSPVTSSGSNESTKTTETTSSNIPSTTESTSYETTTRFVPVVTAGSGRQVRKIVIPVVAVVGTIVLAAVLVSVVVLVVYYLVRRHKSESCSASYDILSNKDSNSNVELLESESPENRRKVGDDLDAHEEL